LSVARFWLELPEGRVDIRAPEDLRDAIRTYGSLHSVGALAELARWDSEAGAVFARKCVWWCLRGACRSALEHGRGQMGSLTIGQVIYLVLAGTSDGVEFGALLARMAPYAPNETEGGVRYVLARLVSEGYVHASEGLFCVPGPKPPIWRAL